MKPLFFLLLSLVLFIPTTQAVPLVIRDVEVTVSDTSAAAAREKAIAQGHREAFGQALEQLGLTPDQIGGIPSDDQIMSLTRGFSPDTERRTATSYAATFTFTFDDQAIRALSQGAQTHTPLAPSHNYVHTPSRQILVQIPLNTLADLKSIEQSLRTLPQVRNYALTSLTRNNAKFTLNIAGEPSQLESTLAQRGWSMENQGGFYILTPNARPHS